MLRKLAFRLALLIVFGLYLAHLIILQGYGVNVPFWDEWEALTPKQLPSGLTLKWLFLQHNEHRIATTKLLTWLLYRLNGWNLITHQTINFLIYGLLLFMLVWFARRYVRQIDSWIILGFLPFLLSPINWENHFWGFQVQFHFSLLFFLAAIYFLYDEKQRWADMLLGSGMAILAIYSFSSGLVSGFVNLLIFALFKSLRSYSASDARERRRERQQLLTVIGLVGVAMALWFVDYHTVGYHPPHAMPYTKEFWTYFVSIVGFGFGVDATEFLPNFFCLLIVLTPIIWDIWRKKGRLPNSSWAVYAAVAGILAALSVITIGRANFGVEQSKSSRYSEIGMMLIPLSVLTWSIFLQDRKRVRAYLLACLWLLCFITFQNNWTEFSNYESAAKQRTRGLLCIESYYAGKGDANCPSLYPESIAKKLDEAQKLNVSFYREIQPYVIITRSAAAQAAGVGKNALYSVDIINGKSVPKDAPVIINSQTTPNIIMAGWAVDAQSQDEAADVFVVIDGKRDIPTTYGQDRPDVAAAHHNPRYRFSGFAVSIPTSNLDKGRHTLSLKILKTLRDGYYEPEQKIEIDVQ